MAKGVHGQSLFVQGVHGQSLVVIVVLSSSCLTSYEPSSFGVFGRAPPFLLGNGM